SDQAHNRRDRVRVAYQRLCAFSTEFDMLHAKVRRTRSRPGKRELGWVGAFPPEDEAFCEPLAGAHDLPACPRTATPIANDRSQVLPDRHAPTPYYLVNVGSIVLGHGSGQAPACEITQELYYLDDDVYDEGELVPPGDVHA